MRYSILTTVLLDTTAQHCLLRTCGIFLLPTGELEDFDRKLLRKVGKSEWVAEAIARGIHKEDLAQSFIRSVVSEKQIDPL